MKVVRIEGNTVVEVIPDYALPVEYWYGDVFASACYIAPDNIDVGWVYDAETGGFSEPSAQEIICAPEETEAEPTTAELLNILMGVEE